MTHVNFQEIMTFPMDDPIFGRGCSSMPRTYLDSRFELRLLLANLMNIFRIKNLKGGRVTSVMTSQRPNSLKVYYSILPTESFFIVVPLYSVYYFISRKKKDDA